MATSIRSPRLRWGYTLVVGLGSFGISLIWSIFNSLLPPRLEDLGLSAGIIGFVLTWDNIINMFVQPWVGERSDRTWTRFGRRKPWIMAGAPMAALFFALIPLVWNRFLYIALAILGTNVGMALFRSPTVAYLGDLFPPEQRSKANGILNLMGGLGGAVALLGGGALYQISPPWPFWAGALVLLLATVIVVIFVKEPGPNEVAWGDAKPSENFWDHLQQVWHDESRQGILILLAIYLWFVGWYAMEAFFTIYARDVLGLNPGSGAQLLTAFAATLIAFAIPSGYIATWLGRKRTILVGLGGMLIGLMLGYFVRKPSLLLVLLAVMGIFGALININSLPMVYDIGGEGRIGAYTGLYYFSSSLAAISGPILAGIIIDWTHQSMIWMFSAFFMVWAFVAMLRLKEPQPSRSYASVA